MSNPSRKNSPVKLLMVFFIFTVTSIPTQGLIARKLDVTNSPDTGGVDKCGSCPCNNPCPQNPPPSPPPPSLPPPPPPPPKKPPTPSAPYCPPPPPPPYAGFIYVNGPPGNLYPIDAFPINGGGRSFAVGVLTPWIVCGLVVGLLAFW